MSSPSSAVVNKTTIYEQFDAIKKKGPMTGLSIAAASFLLFGALIVIMGACMCLTLPGVNVVADIVYPAILPSLAAMIVSIPFWIKGNRSYKEIKRHDKAVLDNATTLFEQHHVLNMGKEDQLAFMRRDLFDDRWKASDKIKLLEKIKKHFAPAQNEDNQDKKRLADSIKEIQKEIGDAYRRAHR